MQLSGGSCLYHFAMVTFKPWVSIAVQLRSLSFMNVKRDTTLHCRSVKTPRTKSTLRIAPILAFVSQEVTT